ncbi:right-handed parallel beta-helix repeat-containing protein [Dysgonomonas macrotermitis]|uniref:Right handed beta helix region n=1 Tax=Dysgonomonas macrotermitis TaxID=1346286 RepID=A0A1M4Y1S0_9BACT|nr:right-handed parallel beta-helix repeat-containing protein [Dysgonomonas macrotermitis]SHE99422.1 Right handed beta helix region [Dysgonomonas macrotermitis]
MKNILRAITLAIIVLSTACSQPKTTANYYFDADNGNDSNTGTTPSQAFKSLSKLNDLVVKGGDSILLRSGSIFTEKFYFSGKGEPGRPIVIGKYGGEAMPHLKGDASHLEMMHIYNSEHIVVRDIEISNKGEKIRPRLSGLFVEIYNYGKAQDITIDNLFIHDVYGSLIKGEGHEHEDAGGGQAMMLRNFRDDNTDSIPSYFDGLLVQNCLIKDSQRNGIIMWGNWIRKAWLPNLNVVIRNNVLDGIPGDGIVPTACDGALVEYNVMKNCPATLPVTEACDGIWPFSSDNTIVQYNVVSGHKSQTDGYGFDSDYNSKNSLFQYNLSDNSEGGFLLLCNSGGWPEDWSAGNQGTIVKYNISINDGIRKHIVKEKKTDFYSPVIHITGPTQNSMIEKNIFYICKKELPGMDKRLVHSDDWRGYADSTYFRNNYIFVEEPTIAFDATRSTNNFIENNYYVGPLQYTGNGFNKYEGKFDKAMWYDASDENWNKLIEFVKDKKVLLNGKEVPVLDVIGYN